MKTFTREGFLKLAGAGAAGAVLLGGSGCGPGPGGGPKTNVILVILDSFRRDHVGAYGNDWMRTPNLDALAGESLRFTRPYPESMPTICARRAIHTGMRTFPFRDYGRRRQEAAPTRGWLPIHEYQATLAEILRAEGYLTLCATDTYVQFPFNFDRGFDKYLKIRGQENDLYMPTWIVSREERERYLPNQDGKTWQYLANTAFRRTEADWFAPRVFTEATGLLEAAHRTEPFFLVADCYDPHEPWDPPEKYVDLYDPDGYRGKEPLASNYGPDDYLTREQLERMRHLYAGEVTMVDRWLGMFLEKARDLGVMQNTLLVLISDHGHALGEHGYTGKPHYALWPELTDIVFMVRYPDGKGAGQTSDYYASTHDVAPTILGALGVEPPEPMDGQNLAVLLDGGDAEPRPHFTLGYGRHLWTRDEGYAMFCRNDRVDTKLYDLRADPEEKKNLAADRPDVVEKMFDDYLLKDAGGPIPTY